ncbi:hypothetical protein BIFCAT_00536 [Bifidobacterium catenulatum DSM 16992 = JCM 1194 = LMG 11043]|uniref:Uncharacterized protein n=1 Tax=Bifidobacterium catenulatum DSM 16992 = JCM 1194 = LMG 11043 TaxID=566552 RepID=B6XTQ7_9BIFI|nr:hypothetical protein BIFCAT_00536 [Bifidobacterium catenulatum DSM 16992 = JCM 1194 = LMG 11043]
MAMQPLFLLSFPSFPAMMPLVCFQCICSAMSVHEFRLYRCPAPVLCYRLRLLWYARQIKPRM